MRKLRFFKALFVAAALALVIPGCSGVDSDEGTNIPQTQGNKVALKISASEGYRTALPKVDLASYTYELAADVVTGNTAAGNPSTLIPARTSYADLIKANSVYVEADKTYLFVLKATKGSSEILSGTLTQKISTSDNSLSFKLFAIDSASDTGSVSISVTYDDGYGVASVVPTLHKADGTSLATDYPLTYTAGDTAGTGTITGSVPVGTSYVKVVLYDKALEENGAVPDGAVELGSLPQEAVYAVKGLTSSSTVNVQVKKYKATIALTTSDDSAPTLTLKNPDITTQGYVGISTSGEDSPFTVTKAGDSAPYTYTYTGYVPTAAYDVYKGATKIGTVQNVNALELNESVTLTSIAVAWKDGTAPTLYVGTTEAELRAALTVTATLSSGTNTVTDYSLSGFDSTATTAQTVTVSYTYNGVEKTAQIAVTLVEDTISSIAVKTEPTTKTFTVGSELDLTGLVITATYASGKTEDVTYDATETTGNASQFDVKYYSDADCGTEVTDITAASAGTYYAKITYAGKTTDKIAVTAEAGATTATEDSWNLVLAKAADGKYYYGDVVFANATNITTGTKFAGSNSVLNLEVTNKFQLGKSGKEAYGILVKSDAITIAGIKGTVKLTVVWGTESKTDRALTVKVGEGDAVNTTATGKNISKETEPDYTITFDAGEGTTVVIGATGDSFIKSITIESSSTPTPTPSTDTVTMGASSYTIDRASTTTATATSTNGNAITFASENTNIFTVAASTGVMTPVHYGTATLTATSSENASATATVKVSRETPIESDTFDFRPGYMVSGTTEASFDYGVISVTKAFLNGNQHGVAINNTGTLSIKVAGASAIYIGNESNGGGGTFTAVKTSDGTTDLTSKLSTTSYAKASSTISTSYTELNDTTKAACQVLYYTGSDPATITLTMNAQAYFPVIFVEKFTPVYTATFSLTAIGSSDITLSCSDGMVTATPPAGATVSAYSWIVDNVSVDTNTATLSVGSLAAGIHSIVVEATDSSTGVKYAAQYVLMVN